jgi:hypothetical protein
MFELIEREVAKFEETYGIWLGTPDGQFEVYFAERSRCG